MNPRYRHGMNWIRQAKRLAIYMRDNFSCLYCGTGIEQAEIILTLDHVVHHGSNDATNLVTACMDCNVSKRCMSLRRYLKECEHPERVQKRIERALGSSIAALLVEAKAVIKARKVEGPF